MMQKKSPGTPAFTPRAHDENAAAITILRDSRMRRIRSFAFSIIVAAIAILAIGIVAFDGDGEIAVQVERIATGDAGEIRVEGLSLKGATGDGKRFAIDADMAAESTDKPNHVNLTGISAAITADDGSEKLTILADGGVYRRDVHTMDLAGGIVIARPLPAPGYTFTASTAFVDFDNGIIRSADKVEGTGPGGDFTAGGFEIREDTGEIKLLRRVTVKLE